MNIPKTRILMMLVASFNATFTAFSMDTPAKEIIPMMLSIAHKANTKTVGFHLPNPAHFATNPQAYQAALKPTLESVLKECDQFAKEHGTHVSFNHMEFSQKNHALVDNSIHQNAYIETFADIVREHNLSNIKTLTFKHHTKQEGELKPIGHGGIHIVNDSDHTGNVSTIKAALYPNHALANTTWLHNVLSKGHKKESSIPGQLNAHSHPSTHHHHSQPTPHKPHSDAHHHSTTHKDDHSATPKPQPKKVTNQPQEKEQVEQPATPQAASTQTASPLKEKIENAADEIKKDIKNAETALVEKAKEEIKNIETALASLKTETTDEVKKDIQEIKTDVASLETKAADGVNKEIKKLETAVVKTAENEIKKVETKATNEIKKVENEATQKVKKEIWETIQAHSGKIALGLASLVAAALYYFDQLPISVTESIGSLLGSLGGNSTSPTSVTA